MLYTGRTRDGRRVTINIEFYGNALGIYIPGETEQKMMNMYGYYPIPGFNGYELMLGLAVDHSIPDLEPSDVGPLSCKVRSTKNFNRYPGGYTLKYTRNNGNKWFELSDNNNFRIKLFLTDILEIFCRNEYIVLETPARCINVGSRNRVKTIPRQKDTSLTEQNKTLKLDVLFKG